MLIGIDASRATAARRTGTEAYSLGVIRGLVRCESPHTFRLYFRDALPAGLVPASRQVEPRPIPFPRLWTHLRLSTELLTRPPEVLYVPAHVLPLLHPVPAVVTVHDLGYLHYPEAHPPADRRYLHWATRFSARGATHVIADSEVTRRDLVANYGLPSSKITVVYPGRAEALSPVRDPERLAAVRRKYGLPADYLLHVGTVQPRKNLIRLIEAVASLQSPVVSRQSSSFILHPSSFILVLAGRRGWLSEPIYARVRELGLEKQVRFLDYVADEDLAALYSGARLYVAPSLYEGFGFTVLEAMACGAPVVCSDGGSLPEVAGNAALIFPARDTAALAAAIDRALADEPLRAELVARGFEQARKFSWDKTARETLAVLEAAASICRNSSPLDTAVP